MVIAAAGIIDGLAGGELDLVLAFAAIIVLTLAVLASSVGHRRPVTLRADLHRWLVQRAERTGEPVDAALDRAVASTRAQLSDETATTDHAMRS